GRGGGRRRHRAHGGGLEPRGVVGAPLRVAPRRGRRGRRAGTDVALGPAPAAPYNGPMTTTETTTTGVDDRTRPTGDAGDASDAAIVEWAEELGRAIAPYTARHDADGTFVGE